MPQKTKRCKGKLSCCLSKGKPVCPSLVISETVDGKKGTSCALPCKAKTSKTDSSESLQPSSVLQQQTASCKSSSISDSQRTNSNVNSYPKQCLNNGTKYSNCEASGGQCDKMRSDIKTFSSSEDAIGYSNLSGSGKCEDWRHHRVPPPPMSPSSCCATDRDEEMAGFVQRMRIQQEQNGVCDDSTNESGNHECPILWYVYFILSPHLILSVVLHMYISSRLRIWSYLLCCICIFHLVSAFDLICCVAYVYFILSPHLILSVVLHMYISSCLCIWSYLWCLHMYISSCLRIWSYLLCCICIFHLVSGYWLSTSSLLSVLLVFAFHFSFSLWCLF